MAGEQLRVGVQRGGGPKPGYRWAVWFLTWAADEARKVLSKEGYAHAVDLLKSLAAEEDPTHPVTVDVDAVEDFYEIRDKGGVLGNINLRIFFIVDSGSKALLVLGVIKKEADGSTPTWAKRRIAHRLRNCLRTA